MSLSVQRTVGRGRSAAFVGLVAAVVVLGAIATVAAVGLEQRDADEREARSAELATLRLGGQLQSTVSALRGATSLGVDGDVSPIEFEAFATDVLADSLYRALALTDVVPGAEREAFEATTGVQIVDTDGAGGFVAAADRPEHLVVTQVEPDTANNASIIGFDITSDPTRRSAASGAAASGAPVLADPIRLASSARPGLFVVHEIPGPEGSPIGFVSSGLAMDDLIAAAMVDPAELGLALDGAPLFGQMRGAQRDVQVAGRTLSVWLDHDTRLNPVTPLLIATGTLAVALIGAVVARRDLRQRRQLAELAERSRLIAQLGERLSRAAMPTEVVRETITASGQILGATSSALLVGEPPGVVRFHPPSDGQFWLDATSPILVSASGVATTLGSDDGASDGTWSAARRAGMRSGLSLPLRDSTGECVGALGFAWTAELRRDELDQLENTVRTLGELVAGALSRSRLGEIIATSAGGLANIAEKLAGASTVGAVRSILEHDVASTVRADDAWIVQDADRPPAWPDSWLCAEIDCPTDAAPWALIADFTDAPGPFDVHEAVLGTIADLAEQTLHRIARTDEEHRLIVHLQREVLSRPPDIEEVDVAVGYEPAMDLVGLGGDFYDVVVSNEGRVHFIIGDIAGHGPEAVVMMAQLKSVMHELLRADVDPAEVLEQADAHLARRRFVATAQIVEFDPTAKTLELTNAGHPYPVLRTAAGAALLTTGRRRLLGLAEGGSNHSPSELFHLQPGDVLVMYTDGLIETRHETIDTGMDRMLHLVRGARATTSHELVREILDSSAVLRPDSDRTDDVAVLSLRAL